MAPDRPWEPNRGKSQVIIPLVRSPDRTVVVTDRLVALGSSARMPLSRSLGDGLFELRFALGPTARRMTYRFTKNGRIILLTTFRKQRNNERSEITRARKAATACAKRYP